MKKEREIYIVIIIILLLLLLASLTAVLIINNQHMQPGKTAVIEQTEEKMLTDTSGGQIRIKINPSVTVKDGTMQNLNFYNYNENRLLKCKIRCGEDYVYESGFVEEGSILKGDFVDITQLKSGENQAVAEVYYYTSEEELLGQTNVKIVLDLVY